jgi:hypothetical protein
MGVATHLTKKKKKEKKKGKIRPARLGVAKLSRPRFGI